MQSEKPITQLLVRWQAGDEDALAQLTPIVYNNLRMLAHSAMRGERKGHTLQATAIVNEAYLNLVDASIDWQGQQHFYAIAARMMRRILVNHANANLAQKRGGDAIKVTLDEHHSVHKDDHQTILDLDRGLSELANSNERTAQVLELHYFSGMTHSEVASALEVSESTAKRELRFAKIWMRKYLDS